MQAAPPHCRKTGLLSSCTPSKSGTGARNAPEAAFRPPLSEQPPPPHTLPPNCGIEARMPFGSLSGNKSCGVGPNASEGRSSRTWPLPALAKMASEAGGNSGPQSSTGEQMAFDFFAPPGRAHGVMFETRGPTPPGDGGVRCPSGLQGRTSCARGAAPAPLFLDVTLEPQAGRRCQHSFLIASSGVVVLLSPPVPSAILSPTANGTTSPRVSSKGFSPSLSRQIGLAVRACNLSLPSSMDMLKCSRLKNCRHSLVTARRCNSC
mmetsp:Transcript_122753/g.347032  ORF Transcript_122753/g.347032 Transcript_122753/m.347032 type:complete len:263 (-) Transcript_122753:2186-2974(-)